ncbi:hypothetical protein DFH06DRAFT_437341 [Mycena polygramma]|nr:hypothetical protein DFH06DRAFT_437341 [Mycena polygramma]
MTAPFALPMHLFPPAFSRRRISDIGPEILAQKEAIAKLKLEREILENHLASYIYPVLTLPNEVVSEIFLQSLDPSDSPFHPSNSLLAGPASPLFLGHICQRWRDIALSTPSLWATISLTTVVRNPARQLQLLDIWLTRSRQCPLSVTIAVNNRFDDRAWLARQFVDCIAPHHKRLEVLMFKVAHGELPKFQGELPLLRVLHIWPVYGTLYTIPPDPVPRMFIGAPKLTTVAIDGSFCTLLPLPWRQLTSLSISHGAVDDVAQVLRMTPHLTDLTAQLNHLSLDLTAESSPPVPPLMHLRSVLLLFCHLASTTLQQRLLGSLTLPALTRLDITDRIVPSVLDLITRSNCPLDRLHTIRIANAEYCAVLGPGGQMTLICAKDQYSQEDASDSDEEDD